MTCQEYQRQWMLGEGMDRSPSEVREHIAGCAECRKFLQESERLRGHLRALARDEIAPRALRLRMERIVHGSSPKTGKWRWLSIWIAAAVVLLALGGYTWHRYSQEPSRVAERLSKDFINDHLHFLPGREEIVSASARQVEEWFRGRTEFPVHVPAIPGAALEDARVCDIAGRKAALLHYRHQKGPLVSLFIAEEPEAMERWGRPVEFSASERGVNSRLWCHGGLAYDLVGPLNEASLQQIAETVRRQEP